jgi:DNA-binding Lrp family transcriptional regulator
MLFDIKEKVVSEAPFQKVDLRRLTKKERTVLKGLVEHPEFTDVALSEEINASRQVISSMKKRFENSGLVKTTRVVDLERLGYEIFAFTHVSFNPHAPLKVRSEGIRKTSEEAPQFFMFSGNSETVICTAHGNYDEYFKTRKGLLAYYSHKGFIVGEPLTELIALSETDIPVNCDFSNLIGEAVTSLPK